jgi:hypothetical protein
MYQTYQPTTLGSTILTVIFYIIMALFALYSLLAIYSLLRFGRARILAITVSLLYLVIAAGLYAAAVSNLNNIKF